MTHFFNNNHVLVENVSFQALTPSSFFNKAGNPVAVLTVYEDDDGLIEV